MGKGKNSYQIVNHDFCLQLLIATARYSWMSWSSVFTFYSLLTGSHSLTFDSNGLWTKMLQFNLSKKREKEKRKKKQNCHGSEGNEVKKWFKDASTLSHKLICLLNWLLQGKCECNFILFEVTFTTLLFWKDEMKE